MTERAEILLTRQRVEASIRKAVEQLPRYFGNMIDPRDFVDDALVYALDEAVSVDAVLKAEDALLKEVIERTQRLQDVNVKDSVKTREINILMQENNTLFQRLTALEAHEGALQNDGVALIAAERARQVSREGWTSEHDNEHRNGEMAISAVRYALEDAGREYPELPELEDAREALAAAWPWQSCDWKPKDPILNLVRAGALIAAEIDRRQRAVAAVSK
jgi:hypothetical protein